MEFKDRLKSLRKENNLTQSKLGEMLNYGYTAIANYESGRNEPHSLSVLIKIASIFNVSLDYLLGVNDIRQPYVINDETEKFNEFRRYFDMLNEDTKDHLLQYMQFLANKDADTKTPSSDPYAESDLNPTILRVAQEPDELH